MELKDRVSVITGGTAGIGFCIAETFAREGAIVIIAGRREETGRKAQEALEKQGAHVRFIQADVGKTDSVRHLVSRTVEKFGRVDILVNNAAIWYREPFLETSEKHWDQVIAVNLKGTFFCSQEAARVMVKQRSGRIVHIGSQAGLYYTEGQGLHYHAAKAAVNHLTRVMAFELGPYNITVNTVAPGGTRTSELKGFMDQLCQNEQFVRQIPLRRFADPEDVAEAALFFASDRARNITGQVLPINAGAMTYLGVGG